MYCEMVTFSPMRNRGQKVGDSRPDYKRAFCSCKQNRLSITICFLLQVKKAILVYQLFTIETGKGTRHVLHSSMTKRCLRDKMLMADDKGRKRGGER